jgi:hypothetical protein
MEKLRLITMYQIRLKSVEGLSLKQDQHSSFRPDGSTLFTPQKTHLCLVATSYTRLQSTCRSGLHKLRKQRKFLQSSDFLFLPNCNGNSLFVTFSLNFTRSLQNKPIFQVCSRSLHTCSKGSHTHGI